MKKDNGFSLLELIIAMGIFSVISIASVGMMFLSLNLRDLSSATTMTEESLRVFNQTFRQASLSTTATAGGGASLLLKNTGECWSFLYDQTIKNVRYEHVVQTGCTPNPNPASLFFPSQTRVNSFSFSVTSLPTGGRQISAQGSLTTVLPFNSYSETFQTTVTNVID